MLAYVIHGGSRTVIDGLRTACVIGGFVLIGLMGRYVESLIRALDFRPGSSWRQRRLANQRLLGRIWLCVCLVLFDLVVMGTEIQQFGQDMGYWRLPVGLLAVGTGIVAMIRLVQVGHHHSGM